MPDLRSLPAFEIGLNGKGTQMSFAANVWNAGDSPLVVDGFRTADEDVMAAYQYFFDTDGDQVAYQSVEDSGFYWHAENHKHWHFEDFARYQLLDADKQVVRDSGKVSFCLANTDAVDYTVAGADWRPDEHRPLDRVRQPQVALGARGPLGRLRRHLRAVPRRAGLRRDQEAWTTARTTSGSAPTRTTPWWSPTPPTTRWTGWSPSTPARTAVGSSAPRRSG